MATPEQRLTTYGMYWCFIHNQLPLHMSLPEFPVSYESGLLLLLLCVYLLFYYNSVALCSLDDLTEIHLSQSC